jgi:hypothetical protein
LEDLLAQSFKKNAVDSGDVSVSHVLQQLPKVSSSMSALADVAA